jgi:hypothetical protein
MESPYSLKIGEWNTSDTGGQVAERFDQCVEEALIVLHATVSSFAHALAARISEFFISLPHSLVSKVSDVPTSLMLA